jgi:hypothetical protein
MSWGVLQGTAVMTLQMKSPTSVEEIRGHTRLMAIHLRLRRAQGVLTVNFPALAPGGPSSTFTIVSRQSQRITADTLSERDACSRVRVEN